MDYKDKSQIPCRNLKKYGKCTSQGCQYMHDVSQVKAKAFKKIQNQQSYQSGFPQQKLHTQYQPMFNSKQQYSSQPIFDRFQKTQQNQQNYNTSQYRNYSNYNQQQNHSYNYNQQNQNRYNSQPFDQNRNYQNRYSQQQYQNQQHSYSNQQQKYIQSQRPPQPFEINQIIKFNLDSCRGFLKPIEIRGVHLFGIITKKAIHFYPIKGQIDLLNKLEFKPLVHEIDNAWFKSCYYQTYLLLSVKESNTTSMRSLYFYPNFLDDQVNYVQLKDVSITEILFCTLNPSTQDIYIFSQDGYVRIFTYNGQFVLKNYYQLEDSIKSVSQTTQEKTFVIGCKNGQLMLLQNEVLTKLNEFKEIQQICLDESNKRILILVQVGESSEIHQIRESVEGPIYTFSRRLSNIKAFKDYNHNNYIVASNQYGEMDFLTEIKEQNDNYSNIIPKYLREFTIPDFHKQQQQYYNQQNNYQQQQQQQQLPEISCLTVFEVINHNQVTEKFIIFYRQLEKQLCQIELYRIQPEL